MSDSPSGLRIARRFTTAGRDPFETIAFTRRRSAIFNTDGSVIFEMNDVEVPESWTQVAVDILVSKYFRKAGVPQVGEDGEILRDADGEPVLGTETSARQWAIRLSNAWRIWGERGGYFASTEDATAFRDELAYMLMTQMGSPNSPQHFNTGLFEAYGIVADPEGNWYVDPETGETKESTHRYERAAVNACFISSVNDELVGPGSIFEFIENEARLFKAGSGSGANFSRIRGKGERLSGGGTSSGVMSFLRVADRAAGAIKSGGTTRRAAKMVILDADHPEVEDFIWSKVREEEKVAALVAGGFSSDWNGEAYDTVAFQNGNNSVRLPEGFMEKVRKGAEWELIARTTGEAMKSLKAKDLWDQIADAAWRCADPGVQFDDILNDWNTAANDARLNGTNPCSEYTHIDDTACNLASLNLVKYFDDETQTFDHEAFQHAVRLFTIVLEISVYMSHYPAEKIARNSFEHRTLGLGYANIGALLMRAGLPYDSPEGLAAIGAITAIMHDTAYATSAELATAVGACKAWERNVEPMSRVLRNHARATYGTRIDESDLGSYEQLNVIPQGVDHDILSRTPFATLSDPIVEAAKQMLSGIDGAGYRNMQVTVEAPTGCLVPQSLVTTDRGLVRLDELGDVQGTKWQDLTGVSVLTDEGEKDATRFYVNGLADVVAVNTKRGYTVTGTPEHRIKTVSADGTWNWRRFGEIGAGELVPLALGQLAGTPREVQLPPLPEMHWTAEFNVTAPRTMTVELAELLGYYMGDGSLHSKKLRFAVGNADPDLVSHLSETGKRLFNVAADVVQGEGCVSVEFTSVALVTWWEACGFTKLTPRPGHKGKGYHPRIPAALRHTNDPEIYRAFLRGLFEADGTLNSAGVPTLSSSAPSFLDEVRSLLLALGYPAASGTTQSGWGGEIGRIRIFGGEYTERFATEIGMLSARKQAILAGMVGGRGTHGDLVPVSLTLLDEVAPVAHWSRGGKDALSELRQSILVARSRTGGRAPRHLVRNLFELTGSEKVGHLLGFFYDEVVSAELSGEEFTYDLSVPENVTYVANGFVSHNTIGLQMDCDTTGIEPDFALVKFKKLAGGGYMKIVNNSVEPALRALGYDEAAIRRILAHAIGTQSLDGPTAVNRGSLLAKGLPARAVERVENQLKAVTELSMAFGTYVVGVDVLEEMGIGEERYTSHDFNLLTHLGYSAAECASSSQVICGHGTVEGAADLRDEHLPVFDTANYCGDGTRVIAWQGHVRALGAVAPHLSGSASKTINLPNEATVDEIRAAYELSYDLGVKCAAVYRDGSKLSQVLSSQKAKEDDAETASELEEIVNVVTTTLLREIEPGESPSQYYHGTTPPKFRLPSERLSRTWKFGVGDQEVFLTGGEYEDGTLGEVWITLGNGKEGTLTSSILHSFAVAISMGLQYGVPLERFVDMFLWHSFQPAGIVTNHKNLKMATSIMDAIFKVLAFHYLGRDDLVQVPDPKPRRSVLLPPGAPRTSGGQLSAPAPLASAVGGRKLDLHPTTPGTTTDADPAAYSVDTRQEPGRNSTGAMFASGEACRNCGGQMVKSGTCSRCLNCGETSGCS